MELDAPHKIPSPPGRECLIEHALIDGSRD